MPDDMYRLKTPGQTTQVRTQGTAAPTPPPAPTVVPGQESRPNRTTTPIGKVPGQVGPPPPFGGTIGGTTPLGGLPTRPNQLDRTHPPTPPIKVPGQGPQTTAMPTIGSVTPTLGGPPQPPLEGQVKPDDRPVAPPMLPEPSVPPLKPEQPYYDPRSAGGAPGDVYDEATQTWSNPASIAAHQAKLDAGYTWVPGGSTNNNGVYSAHGGYYVPPASTTPKPMPTVGQLSTLAPRPTPRPTPRPMRDDPRIPTKPINNPSNKPMPTSDYMASNLDAPIKRPPQAANPLFRGRGKKVGLNRTMRQRTVAKQNQENKARQDRTREER